MENKIIKIENEIEPLKDCQLTPVGLEIRKGLPFEKWDKIGESLRRLNGALLWWWGDWLNYGEREYGESYSQAVKESPYELSTLQTIKSICGNIKSLTRVKDLPFSIHRVVAPLEEKDQIKWLKKAKENNWTRQELRQAIKESKQKDIPLPKGKYEIIYADPPWQYWEGGEKNQSRHYPTMDINDIKALPVQDLAANNCILFLWATYPAMKEAIETIEAWGFQYSTAGFVWVKSKKDGTGFAFGNGSWTRANTEVCLIGTKGTIERKDASISQIIYEPREEHSKKPDIVKDKIIQLVGDLPRIELFARQKTKGWDVWGNEI